MRITKAILRRAKDRVMLRIEEILKAFGEGRLKEMYAAKFSAARDCPDNAEMLRFLMYGVLENEIPASWYD